MTTKSNNPETLVLHAGPRSDADDRRGCRADRTDAHPISSATRSTRRTCSHSRNSATSTRASGTRPAMRSSRRLPRIEGGAGSPRGQLRPGGLGNVDPEPVPSRRQHRKLHRSLRRHLEPVRQHAAVDGHRPRASSIRPIPRPSDAPPTTRTRAYYAETLPNPKLTVFPIGEVAAIGRSLGVPLIMDNTAAPIICRPFDHGAAIVVHSTTKYIGGHGTSIGGIIVDGGNFDWAAHKERFPTLNEPDPSYHGAVWTEAMKPLGPDRLHHPRPRRAAARYRRVHEPLQRLPVHPGARDAAARGCASTAATPRRSRSICSAIPK